MEETKGKVDILLGIVYGDEGKGKIVDYLAPNYDVIARFAGGPNAGHTLIFDNKKAVLRSIPSGIFRDNIKYNIIGNGCVVDPVLLVKEYNEIKNAGGFVDRLIISDNAHLILPTHKLLDKTYEDLKGDKKVGTTGKGIGPCYSDKALRIGIRICDIFKFSFEENVNKLLARHKDLISHYNNDTYAFGKTVGKNGVLYDEEKHIDEVNEWYEAVQFIKKYIRVESTEHLLYDLITCDEYKILAEGAQGTLLDIDHGTYPYVSSSNTVAGGVCTGLGISPKFIDKIYGCFKAYTTRVGEGPFVTELTNEIDDKLREYGHEYGAVTGRNRRCGWLDIPALRQSIEVNGITDLVILKSDVLDNFEEINVCGLYNHNNGTELIHVPNNNELDKYIPKYIPFSWYGKATKNCKTYEELPEGFKYLISCIENATDTPVSIISVGPDREETIVKVP